MARSRVLKVVSGGQIGADIAGLKVAKLLNLKTGGWIPAGFRTKAGNKPSYGVEYGLVETPELGYKPRTFRNVRDSDATIRLAVNFNTPGEVCTLKAINRYNKPHLDVRFRLHGGRPTPTLSPAEVRVWLAENNVEVLNVAGNALTPLEGPVYEFLYRVLAG